MSDISKEDIVSLVKIHSRVDKDTLVSIICNVYRVRGITWEQLTWIEDALNEVKKRA